MIKRFFAAFVAIVMALAVCPVLTGAETADIQSLYDSITAESVTQNELEDFVTKDLVLPAAPEGITISWESSDESAITKDGKVTRADVVDKTVTLTATISDGSQTLTKEINLNVVANATNVFYQNNFHYPQLVGTSTVVTSDIGWTDNGSGQTTVEKSIKTDDDGNHYLYMDHASTAGYPQIGPTFSAKGSKITIRMDISVDATNGTTKLIDLWLGMVKGTSIEYSKPRMITDANNVTSISGINNLKFDTLPSRTELYIELDMENLTMRAKKGQDGEWSNSMNMPSANTEWTGEIKSLLFRRGSGSSPAAVLEVDNMIVYEERDRASYADSLDVDKTIAVLDLSKMTSEDINNITRDLDLNYAELQAANTANGTTVTFESSNPDVIEIADGKGIVKRGYEAQEVTLTATVSKGSYSDSTKKFIFTVPASEAATEIKNALAFSNMSNQSNFAVTNDLNLSYTAIADVKAKYGAEITFESSDDSVIQVVNGTGIINRGDAEKTATLTATAVVDGVTFTREHNIVVPATSTYVFKSEDFGYPEYEGEKISEIGWVCETDPTRFTTTIEQIDGDYYIEGYLPQTDTGTRRPSFTFQNDRDVKKISVEYTATYMEDSGVNAIYEFEFYGGTTGSDLDTSKTIARIQSTGTSMAIYGHTEESTAYHGAKACTATRATRGNSDRYRFDFDFVNQGYDFYLNGERKNTDLIPFASGMNYNSFKKFNFAAYREAVGSKILIDDFVIQARDVEFTQDYVSEAGQPLTVEVSFKDTNYNDAVHMYVTSDYDEEYNLRQLFTVNNAGGELVKNVIFDYRDAYLVNKESGAKTQLIGLPTADETAPPLFPQTYLGGNHGVSFGVRVTSANHGKTYNDIGSVWLDDAGVQWTLVRVNSESELVFLSETEKKNGTWAFVKNITGTTLTYDESADNNFALNETAITIDAIAETSMQLQPAIGNRVQKMYIYRDGESSEYVEVDSIREGFTVNCSKVILDETYDIMDPSKIGYHLREYRPDGGYTAPADIAEGGTPIMRYHQTITIHEDGDVTIEHDHEMLETFKSFSYYGYQYYEKADVFGGGVFRYMPGVKGITSGDRFYDFSKPFDMTNDALPGTYIASKDLWANENLAPDRTIEYYRDTDGKNRMAFVAGFVPILDAAPDVRTENISSALTMYNRTGMKVYPMLVNNASKFAQEGAKIQGVVFRHYDNLDQSTDAVTAYDVEYKDDVYYYVDFMEDAENFTLDLSKKTVASDYELVYKTDDVTYSIDGNKLIVSGKQSGYICVKGKRSAEIATVAYDNATHKLAVWLNNRAETQVTGDIVIAGFNGDKCKSISVKKNVTLTADDFTRLDIEDFDDSGVTDIKVFLVHKGTLTPVNFAKIISVE